MAESQVIETSRFKTIFFAIIGGMLLFGNTGISLANDAVASPEVPQELQGLGRQGALIARVRLQVLEILEGQNSCAAWYQESDTDVAEVFRSLHYEVYLKGTPFVNAARNNQGFMVYKDPWAAMVTPSAGREGTILINRNGPFFVRHSLVVSASTEAPLTSWRRLTVGAYSGDSDGARMIVLLHELGHIIRRIPEDDDSWDGQSTRNTEEVLRHCKKEVESSARRNPHPAD